MSLELSSEHITLPRKSRVEHIENNRMLLRGHEEFYLSNRTFRDIDLYFSNNISQEIEERIAHAGNDPIQIVDIGGGIHSQSVGDIQRQYEGRVHVTNIDIAHAVLPGQNVDRVQADVRKLPLKSESVDLVYARQVFPFLGRLTKEHLPSVINGLSEIGRILKSGGHAYIDDEEDISGKRHTALRQHLSEKLGVELLVDQSNQKITERDFPRMWKVVTRPMNFLILAKP